MAYLYRHIRLDKNEPFYIGIGSDPAHKRAYAKTCRNRYWLNIAKLNPDYEVEIIFDNIPWREACLKEIEFISIYGRRDLKEGVLCNLTNGGEGCPGKVTSQETKDKISASVKRNTHWKNGRKHTGEARMKIKNAGEKKVINTKTGVIYDSITLAALSEGIIQTTLARKVKGTRTNNTHFKLL